jgi:hypothetical protein
LKKVIAPWWHMLSYGAPGSCRQLKIPMEALSMSNEKHSTHDTVTETQTLTDSDISVDRRVGRRSALGVIGGLAAAGAVAAVISPRTAQAKATDSDATDQGGHGRGAGNGHTDSDPNDHGGQGRSGQTDSDPNDHGGHGRGGATDGDPNDHGGAGRH